MPKRNNRGDFLVFMKLILLVEDDSFLIDIYTTKFREAGFDVESVVDGAEALRKIKEKKPDLVVLDIVLPHQDGWEVIEKIKKEKKLKDIKIIILSNLGQRSEVEKGLRLGAVKYLIKAHYTPTQVLEEVEKVLL